MPPRIPKLKLKLPTHPLEPLREMVRGGRERLEEASSAIHSIAEDIRGNIPNTTSSTIQEPPKAPQIEPRSRPASTGVTTEEATAASVSAGTACLPCCRDHLSTSSSALSEGMRFARDKGIKDPEALRRVRIALDELNVMERIDLAPDETAKLKGAEKDLAIWTLKGSREIRHAITAIKDVESMEQAAAKASAITEEFISRLWAIPAEDCETCGEVRESIRQFVEKRKRERAGEG